MPTNLLWNHLASNLYENVLEFKSYVFHKQWLVPYYKPEIKNICDIVTSKLQFQHGAKTVLAKKELRIHKSFIKFLKNIQHKIMYINASLGSHLFCTMMSQTLKLGIILLTGTFK